MFAQPEQAARVGVRESELPHLRPGEPLVPVVIGVSARLPIPPSGVVAEHLGVGLEHVVQGVQAVGAPDLLPVCQSLSLRVEQVPVGIHDAEELSL